MNDLDQMFATLHARHNEQEMHSFKVQAIAASSGYHPLLQDLIAGREYLQLLNDPDRATHRDQWRALFADLQSRAPHDALLVEHFETQWHVAHHHIRALIEDDPLLLDTLWAWLPRYQGSDRLLYRGENIDRWERQSIGWAWTCRVDIAERFASGLNAVGGGGVILRAAVPAHAIIAGPSAHSRWLGENEYTLDTRRLDGLVVEVQRFPPST